MSKYMSFCATLCFINIAAGRIGQAMGPHAACGPPVWHACITLMCRYLNLEVFWYPNRVGVLGIWTGGLGINNSDTKTSVITVILTIFDHYKHEIIMITYAKPNQELAFVHYNREFAIAVIVITEFDCMIFWKNSLIVICFTILSLSMADCCQQMTVW